MSFWDAIIAQCNADAQNQDRIVINNDSDEDDDFCELVEGSDGSF